MTELHPSKNEYQIQGRTVEYLRNSLKQNWTTSVLREELALLDSMMTGRRQTPTYVFETETQREFIDPKLRSIKHLKHIEQNRLGRYAYTPKQIPPRGTIPTYEGVVYPEVIPRFHLPKMPF